MKRRVSCLKRMRGVCQSRGTFLTRSQLYPAAAATERRVRSRRVHDAVTRAFQNDVFVNN